MARANRHHISGQVWGTLVRAGVVWHPSEWEMNGYNEIQNPPTRYGIIDPQELQRLCGIPDFEGVKKEYRQWVDSGVTDGRFSEKVIGQR